MEIKLSILLLLSTVAQGSLPSAHDTGSCADGTTIAASLAKIQLAEDTPNNGLAKVARLINSELVTILTNDSTSAEEVDLRAKRAQTESFDAFMIGIPPTAEAYTILQPELNVSAVVDVLRASLLGTNDAIWTAIGIVRAATNYSESLTDVQNMFASGGPVVAQLIDDLYGLMLNGTALIPEGAEDVVACVKAQASSELLAAVAGVANEMYIVLEAKFYAKNRDDLKNYLFKISAAHEQVLKYFHREVIHKVSILRNIVIADYLKKYGAVNGLFDLQAASGNRFI